MIFIGVLLLLNLHFTGGLLLIAGGVWFLLDNIFIVTPEIIQNFLLAGCNNIDWPVIYIIFIF